MSSTAQKRNKRDRVTLIALLIIGVVISIATPGGESRQWFALMAFLCSLLFVIRYSIRPWRSTSAGVAVMMSMSVMMIFTGHASLMFFYPNVVYGYPHWQTIVEIIYLLIAISALYKIRALTRDGSGKGSDRCKDADKRPAGD